MPSGSLLWPSPANQHYIGKYRLSDGRYLGKLRLPNHSAFGYEGLDAMCLRPAGLSAVASGGKTYLYVTDVSISEQHTGPYPRPENYGPGLYMFDVTKWKVVAYVSPGEFGWYPKHVRFMATMSIWPAASAGIHDALWLGLSSPKHYKYTDNPGWSFAEGEGFDMSVVGENIYVIGGDKDDDGTYGQWIVKLDLNGKLLNRFKAKGWHPAGVIHGGKLWTVYVPAGSSLANLLSYPLSFKGYTEKQLPSQVLMDANTHMDIAGIHG